MWSAGNPRDAGFTLIEMVTVIAIMTLMTGVLFPSIRTMVDASGLLNNATQLSAQLAIARASAIRSDRHVRFDRNASRQLYQIDGARRQLPGDLEFARGSSDQIVFNGDGSSSGGQLVILSGRRAAAIRVDTLSGAILPAELMARPRSP